MNGAELIVKILEDKNVKLIFGLPGYNILPIYEAIRKSNIEHVLVKHEHASAIMADVYGRLTLKPGISLVTAGPGALNSATGVATAYSACSPMLHLTGHCSTQDKIQPFHGVDEWLFLEKIFKNITKWSKTLTDPEDIAESLNKAFRIASSGRKGPVHLSFPTDILEAEIKGESEIKENYQLKFKMEMDEIFEALKSSDKPLIVAGKGVLRTGAWSELKAFAEEIYAPISISRRNRDILPFSEPLYTGYMVVGAFTRNLPEQIVKLFEETDLILTFGLERGVRMQRMFTETAEKRKIRIIHVYQEDILPRIKRKGEILEVNIPNLKGFIQDATIKIKGKYRSKWRNLEERIRRIKEEIEKELREFAYQHSDEKPIHPAYLVQLIKEKVEKNAILTLDVGGSSSWMELYHRSETSNSILSPERFGSMGYAFPAAIAAKKIKPERQVVGVTGDGGLLMNLSEISTAVEQRSDIKIFVMNDYKYTMILRLQISRFGYPPFQVDIHTPNFAECAKSFGAKGLRCEDPKDLESIVEEALNMKGPLIVDVNTTCQYEFYKYRV